MKKLMLIVAILTMIVGKAIASGVAPPPLPDGVLTPDNPSWTGTKYNGNPSIFSNTLIGENVNYIDVITVQAGLINARLPGQTAFALQMAASVKIQSSSYNNIGYKNALANYQAWARVKPTVLDGSPNAFEDSGILYDNAYLDSIAFNPGANIPSQGMRPWFITYTVYMDYNTYLNSFKPGLDAWLAQTNIMGAPNVIPINDHGLNGTFYQWKRK